MSRNNGDNKVPIRNSYNGSSSSQNNHRWHSRTAPQRNGRNYDHKGEQSNRGNNYKRGQRNYDDNDTNERGRRGSPNVHASEQRRANRTAPYDTVSRSRQSSVRPQSRVRPPSFLSGWDSNEDQVNVPQANVPQVNVPQVNVPTVSNPTYKLNPSRDDEKGTKSSSSSAEKTKVSEQADDVEWVISDQTSSNSVVSGRPLSPVWVDLDYFDKKDDDNKRDYKGKSKSSRPPVRHYEVIKSPEDDDNDYKGVSFCPPFPMAPVSSTSDFPKERPKVSRIFENDSRSSAQSFEQLALLSKTMWSKSTDVPLNLAAEHDINPDKLAMVLKDFDKNVPTEKPTSNTKPNNGKCNPDSTYSRSSSSTTMSSSTMSISTTITSNNPSSPNPKVPEDKKSSRRPNNTLYDCTIQLLRNANAIHKDVRIKEKKVTVIDKKNNLERTTQTRTTEEKIIEYNDQQLIQIRRKDERIPEAEEVCNMVDAIFRTNNANWLNCTLGAAHKLIPNIMLLDTSTLQKLLKILSSKLVLDTNNNDTKHLINMFIDEPNFFKKIFSYMKEEVNCGSDLVPVVRLSDFIVKISPNVADRIPCEDINEVCTKVGGTFSEAESDEVFAKLEDIKEYRSRALKKADEKKKIEYHKKIADHLEAPFQMKESIKPSNPPSPDWIASHRFKYREKSLTPSPDEVFNLKAMMTEPILTPHLVNLSWLPEYEDIYRQIHYDLLRTEVVEDLQRASVAFFAANCQGYKSSDNSLFYNYVFYHDVRIDETYIDKDFTPCVKVGFKPSRPVDWIKGEHLIYGTVVLLFKVKDEFNNISVDTSKVVCAIVEHFNLDDVMSPNNDECFIGLNFSESEFDKLDLNGKYVMLESTRNYASIRPVMEWLKESSKGIQRSSPLYQELFTCCFDNNPIPDYLENVAFDITTILVDQRRPVITSDRKEWPSYINSYGHPAYNMELSCVIALRQIISRKVAVIMAPVVTSKAKVASKAVEFLNRALKRSQCFEPILILTRSSYALDSILEKLLPTFPDLIRCGSLSKCNNPALKARQIQNVVNEYLTFRKSTLWKDWFRIRREMNGKQEELAALWSFRQFVLSPLHFVRSCPQAFKNQLIPADLKKRGYGLDSEKILVHCLELWLSGSSESNVAESLKKKISNVDISQFPSSSSRLNLPTFVSNQDSPHQGIVELNLAINNFLFTNEMINIGIQPHQVSPSLFTELSESYLFENDRTKSNGVYDGDISISSALNKEILDQQIDDRVIFKSEEDSREGNNHNYSKYRNDFFDMTKGFWGDGGPNIWIMTLDERKSLYNNFYQHHVKLIDPRIINLQKDAILEEEKVKSVRIARWTEVCNFAPVIGMTMNYAIANREVLNTLKPRVCIVDEASEISEAQLMFLIASNRLEHLIMFGDTQYSKPDVKSKTAQKYGLDISLFERWIKCDGGDHVRLKQQSRMHPEVHELVRVLYDEKDDKNENKNIPAKDNPIMGVPSHVFFMTHDNFDENSKFCSTNTFEAKFVINFAFYLYQQGYDPAKITILTPYFAQKRLILELLNPELKKEPQDDNIFGRFDKDRNKTGKIKVELIDNYYSDENEIVLLSLVAVSENWHEEALKMLNDKKRAIIALSRALNALYIFGNQKMLSKSEIWAPVVKKLANTRKFSNNHLT
jgi:hypothetical protein